MKTSKDRILTSHAGSLPRTEKLAKLLIERDNDLAVDEAECAARSSALPIGW